MPERTVTLHAVGDLAFGDHPLCAGFGAHSHHRKRGPGFAFERAREALAGADIVFGNLECTLSEEGLRRGDYHSIQMRGGPAYLDGLVEAGFTVLNLANNHSLQHGEPAFRDTERMLRARGIAVCGVHNGDFRHAAPAVVERNGLRVAFLGYSMRPRQYFTREPLYAEGHAETMVEDVRRVRAECDCVVVSLHWGSEFIDRPAPDEVAIARRIVDSGADLVIGHHPHVLRGIERRGRGIIAYSLGNFVCDMVWEERLRESAIAAFRLTPAGAELIHMVPVRINDDYQPAPLHGGHAAQLLERIEAMSVALRRHDDAESESQQAYEHAADAAQRANRSRSHRYFLRHLHRFPPGLVIQQFRVWLRNRLADRGLLRVPDPPAGC